MKIDFDIVVSVFETIKIVNEKEKEKQKEQVKASSTQINIDNINITTDSL
jgi:hypothetical protein